MLRGAFGSSSGTEIDKAKRDDVRFVLNWCRLGDQRIEQVLHSYVSAQDITGDHSDAYAIKINKLEISELTEAGASIDGGWYRGDKASPLLREAVGLASGIGGQWFPSANEILTERYYIWVWDISLHGLYPSAARIIYVRPEDKMVFYAEIKT
jgi:hypothetical protein